MAVSKTRFAELVEDALDGIPRDLLRLLDNVVVLVEARNREEPGLLGLYRGVALTERNTEYSFQLPDTITLYRDAIVDICSDEAEVAAEVRTTVVHELGHHFGISDERLHELGWG